MPLAFVQEIQAELQAELDEFFDSHLEIVLPDDIWAELGAGHEPVINRNSKSPAKVIAYKLAYLILKQDLSKPDIFAKVIDYYFVLAVCFVLRLTLSSCYLLDQVRAFTPPSFTFRAYSGINNIGEATQALKQIVENRNVQQNLVKVKSHNVFMESMREAFPGHF